MTPSFDSNDHETDSEDDDGGDTTSEFVVSAEQIRRGEFKTLDDLKENLRKENK